MSKVDPAAIEAIAREALAAWDENSTPHTLATGALALAERNRRLVEALRRLEWSGGECDICGSPTRIAGHEKDCALAALLAEDDDRG